MLRTLFCRLLLSKVSTVVCVFAFVFDSGNAQAALLCRGLFSPFTPAQQQLAQSNPQSRRFWNNFSKRFQESVQQHFVMHSGTSSYEFPLRRSDSHIEFLRELGFALPIKGAAPKAPPLVEMLQALQLKVQKNIDLGLISVEDALFPHMVISAIRADQVEYYRKNPEKADQFDMIRSIGVEPGGNLPGKFLYVENSSDLPATNLLSTTDYYKMIASGFFPIGGLRPATATYKSNNEILHDLAHWSAMILNPKLMAAVKRHAKKEANQVTSEQNKSPWYELLDFVANEGLIVVNQKENDKLPSYLGLEKLLAKNSHPQIEDIKNHYKTLSEKEVDKLKYQIDVRFEEQFEFIGGAARDYVSAITIPNRQFLYKGLFKRATSYKNPESDEAKLKALATFAYFTLLTREWSASHWYDFLLSENNSQSPILRILIDNLEATY